MGHYHARYAQGDPIVQLLGPRNVKKGLIVIDTRGAIAPEDARQPAADGVAAQVLSAERLVDENDDRRFFARILRQKTASTAFWRLISEATFRQSWLARSR